MASRQEHSPAEVEALEKQFHEEATPWVADQSSRAGSKIVDIGYDPVAFPWQRLDEAFTPAQAFDRRVPNKVLILGMKLYLAKNLGSLGKVNRLVTSFKDTPAFDGADVSIAESYAERIENNESVGVLADHTDAADQRDIGIVMGGLLISTGKSSLREKSYVFMGKNIGRQARKKWPEFRKAKPLAEQSTKGFGVIWVVQDTDKRKGFDFSPLAIRYINGGAAMAMVELQEEGVGYGLVPSGSSMTAGRGPNGEDVLERTPVSKSTVVLMKRLNSLLPVGLSKGRAIPGPFYTAEKSGSLNETRSSQRKAMVTAALGRLAQSNSNLTQKPIVHQDLDGNEVISYPEGR